MIDDCYKWKYRPDQNLELLPYQKNLQKEFLSQFQKKEEPKTLCQTFKSCLLNFLLSIISIAFVISFGYMFFFLLLPEILKLAVENEIAWAKGLVIGFFLLFLLYMTGLSSENRETTY